jgi:hypothetical protein
MTVLIWLGGEFGAFDWRFRLLKLSMELQTAEAFNLGSDC